MNPKFLIVDDDPGCTALLAAMLQSLGCESVAVNSATEADRILSDRAQVDGFEAVFLDVMMPEIDGLEVLRRFRARPHGVEVPVLLLTALDKPDQVLSGYSQGATYYITKPFSQEQIVFGLDMLLGAGEDEGKEEKVFHLDE